MMIIIWFIDQHWLCSNFSLTSVLLEMKWTSNAPPNSFEARVWITTTPANTNELFVCQKAESVFFLISASPDKKGTSCYSNWTLTLGRQCRVLVRWLVSASVIKASSKLIIRWRSDAKTNQRNRRRVLFLNCILFDSRNRLSGRNLISFLRKHVTGRREEKSSADIGLCCWLTTDGSMTLQLVKNS